MKLLMTLLLALATATALAQNYPAPQDELAELLQSAPRRGQ
jgi:hypothetical protein